jgi:predicted hydrocarbon binding protein
MNPSISATSYSDRMGQIILWGMEEIIGQGEVQAVLKQACLPEMILPSGQQWNVSFNKTCQLQASLETVYGASAGRGVAVRSGRACFRHILREFGSELGLMGLDFRLLPTIRKIKFCSRSLASLFNQHTDQHVEIVSEDSYIQWHFERCPFCREQHTHSPACYLTVGLLQEALSWASGGKIFKVEETHCIASGDPRCTIRIKNHPVK